MIEILQTIKIACAKKSGCFFFNVKTDPQTGRSRCFASIVFAATDAIDKVTEAHHAKIVVGGLNTEISDDEIKIPKVTW